MTVRVPVGLHEEAKRIAERREVALNTVMVDLLRKWVEHFGRQG